MKLWKKDTENWTAREIEGEPWPGTDAEGDVCYENTHFRTEAAAWASLAAGAAARCELALGRLEQAKAALAAAEMEANSAKFTLARLEHLRPPATGCAHPSEHRKPGQRVPLRYGSAETEVCAACGAWRTLAHGPGRWNTTPIEEALVEADEY